MKILITGSNGFIGSYFVRKYGNTYTFQKFSFLQDNFDALKLNEVDAVLHLSALVHQMDGANAEEYNKINVLQTLDLAKKAKQCGVKHFVFMSSVKVYGEETESVYTENSPCNPTDPYGTSKLKAEHYLQKLESETFTLSIIRTPIVYGYGVKANIRSLIELITKAPVLPIIGTDNKRSMVYIGNVCHLIHAVITQKKHGIFLAADDYPLSTMDLIKLIARNLDKKVIFVRIPFLETILKNIKPSFYKRLCKSLEVDNNITKKRLNLSNPYSNEEGISLMLSNIP